MTPFRFIFLSVTCILNIKKYDQMQPIKSRILAVLLLAWCLGAGNNMYAQSSDNATLNVVLADVRSIKLNPAQTTVRLNFNNATDYQNGVFMDNLSHLEVTSTGGFQIKVKSSGTFLQNGINTIPVNTITLRPTVTSGYTDAGLGLQTITLSATNQQMVTTPNGSSRMFFDVRYTASGGQPYINKPAGTYVTTITFSIEPS
jgi:hypothetical protein